jgi:hypothetical protein
MAAALAARDRAGDEHSQSRPWLGSHAVAHENALARVRCYLVTLTRVEGPVSLCEEVFGRIACARLATIQRRLIGLLPNQYN